MKKILHVLLLLNTIGVFSQALKVEKLRCEYKNNPVGVDLPNPRLSWIISADTASNNILQTAYHVQVVSGKPDFSQSTNLIWDSKKVESDHSLFIEYAGNKLAAKTRYYWRVKIWDNHKRESKWSPTSYWETGLSDTSLWKAKWIAPEIEEKESFENPLPMFRKQFQLNGNIKKARLYITSHGIYQATINGKPVSDELFAPGWTTYNKRLQYQIYDVTDLLIKGNNATGVILGDGWFRGRRFGQKTRWDIYGKKPALLYQLEVELTTGEVISILSDNTWKTGTGPFRSSSIYDGALYDANYELVNWDKPGFDDTKWKGTVQENYSLSNLVSNIGVPVRRIEELSAKKEIVTPKKELVFDFGQNLTGRVRFSLKGNKGDTITILHAEVLDNAGNFYTENLRSAKQQIRYIFKDDKPVVFEPEFTFQGFRYIQIKDFSGKVTKENFTAEVIHSDMEQTGSFECSNPQINQLHSNIRWGMKGNFLDIPSDCPQRDERLGWAGDAQVFSSTSNLLYNTSSFYLKWLEDLKVEQFPDGNMPHVIPNVIRDKGSSGWGDVATILPFNLYLSYGDKRILEQQYTSMKKWTDYLRSLAKKNWIVDSGFHYGDWLFFIHPTRWDDKPGHTDKDLIATAFLAYSTHLVAQTATIIGNTSDAETYNKQFLAIKKAFQKEFMTSTGRLSSNSQTAYSLALTFNLMPDSLKQAAVNYLVDDIRKRSYHISTGFLGTPYICHALSENGQNNTAYKLLLQKTYPSWIYPITKGATTIWERWDGIKPDGSFQTTDMNSFNHYAYGAIGYWLYSKAAGIQTDIDKPGYKHIIIKPEPDSQLSYINASYTSLYGTIKTSWNLNGNNIQVFVEIPSNTTATIYLPYSNEKKEVGSGRYRYNYKIKE